MAKKVKAPKGSQLALERPSKLKGDQIRRDYKTSREGPHAPLFDNESTPKKMIEKLKREVKVKSAFKVGKFKKS